MSGPKTAVIIYNHQLNEEAIELKKRFNGKIATYLFDSGSDISGKQRPHFDKIFENIYYNGLLNETNKFLKRNAYSVGIIITSDVEIGDVDQFLDRATGAFSSGRVGLYAPSAEYSYHPHMMNKPGKGLVEVPFTEGFCFGVRSGILDCLCPVDLAVNKYGYGSDILLGYYALDKGFKTVVDHRMVVSHPYGSGYDISKAVEAKHKWISTLGFRERLFYKIASKKMFKNSFGLFLIHYLLGFGR